MKPRLSLQQAPATPTPPPPPPPLVSYVEVRERLRLDDVVSDDGIGLVLDDAVAYIEGETGLVLPKGDWKGAYERFPPDGAALVFPGLRAELTNLTYDTGQSPTLLGVEGLSRHPRGDLEIRMAPGRPWPREADSWSITVTGKRGADASTLPGDLKAAVLLEWAQLYDGEDPARSRAIKDICRRYWP